MTREAAEYTSSLSFDSEIYRETILINAVHLKMLSKLGYISKTDAEEALKVLKEMIEKPISLDNTSLEDVHIGH
jgi:argininosuccinate lyase